MAICHSKVVYQPIIYCTIHSIMSFTDLAPLLFFSSRPKAWQPVGQQDRKLLCQRACPYRCFWNPVTHWSSLCIAHLYVLRAQICVCQLIDYELFSAAADWFHWNALDVSTAKSNTFSHADLNFWASCFLSAVSVCCRHPANTTQFI